MHWRSGESDVCSARECNKLFSILSHKRVTKVHNLFSVVTFHGRGVALNGGKLVGIKSAKRHLSEPKLKTMEDPRQQLHVCGSCYVGFHSKALLKVHSKLCGGQVPQSAVQTVSGVLDIKAGNSEEKPHVCEICYLVFETEDLCKDHKLTCSDGKSYDISSMHAGKNLHKCDQCDKVYTKKSYLNTHKMTHTGERPYKCDQCEKTFRFKYDLERHNLTHTGEKPYQCDQCDKSFTQGSTLKAHLRTHTGEKPYQCGVCGTKFRQGSILRGHMRTHTDESPYQCDQCEKRFKKRHNLKRHSWTHTGGPKSHKCDECGKTFNYKQSLKDHCMVHTGKKPYKCIQCDKYFARDTYLEKHVRTHHAENVTSIENNDTPPETDDSGEESIQTNDTEEKPQICDTCYLVFESDESYKEHRLTCCEEKPNVGHLEMENIAGNDENE